jgi:bleomycin hydrolase
MKKLQLFLFSALAFQPGAFNLSAQQKQDKANYIEYSNEFYDEIKKGISDFEEKDKEPSQGFKMDYSNYDIPKSKEEFTTVWCGAPISQGSTGTCWSFSTSSYFESEVFRTTKKEVKLSELYIVYWEYVEKATYFVQTRGSSTFPEGSEANAVSRMMKKYGAMPWDVFNGLKKGQVFHDHSSLFNEMTAYLATIKRDNNWNEEVAIGTIKSILNHHIGTPPTSFKVGEKEITPLMYLSDELKLNMDGYVNFMSLLEVPFYTKGEYDVPDNWWNSADYNNIPLTDFMSILKTAVKQGYSIAIGGDVSETGYSPSDDVAMIPSYDIPSAYINDEARQLRFSNGSTTDDHAIHVVGYKETKDDFWFLIKDSGSGARNGKNEGYYFYHEDFVKLKTMNFTIHKDAVTSTLKKIK